MEKRKNVQLTTPVFRVSYPSLAEASSYEGGAPKYQVTCIVPKVFGEGYPDPKGNNEKRMAAIKNAIESVGTAAFGNEWQKFKKRQHAYPIRDGGEKEGKDGYGADVEYFAPKTLKTNGKPIVFNRRKVPIEAEECYSGCYAIATINVYATEKGGPKVCLGLRHVMKIADGDPFGSRGNPEDDFEEWEDPNEEDEF